LNPADKALRALGPARPATCPRGFAAPSPARAPERSIPPYVSTGAQRRHSQRVGSRGRRRALLADARRGRCGTLPGFRSQSSAVVALVS
jgi:hypothetical protein